MWSLIVFKELRYTDAVNPQKGPIGLQFYSYSSTLQTPTHTSQNMRDVATDSINDSSYDNTDDNKPL